MADLRDRCTERVPPRLCGGLKGDARPQCERAGNHKRHRAERYLRGVGKTSWEWKSETAPQLEVKKAPAKKKIKRWAPKESHGRCGCEGMFHICDSYRDLLRL